MWAWISLFCALVLTIEGAGVGAARLVCYVDSTRMSDSYAECTHLIYAGNARGDKLDAILKDYRKLNARSKILVRVSADEKELRTLLKSKHVQGLEIQDAHRGLNKTTAQDSVKAARAAIASSGGGPLFLSLPSSPELLAKYYDLRALVKMVDLMVLETDRLGAESRKTYHPSRLSGMWDMMNTDSVVDLVVGLGVPASKVVITLPATAFQFTLTNETLSTPGSPAVEDQPREIDQAELCRMMQKGRWTLERDQDLSAPYAFKNTTWISFEDASSVDVKGKYARVRGLAGLALKKADRDQETPCGPSLKAALAKVLNQQSRAPRAAVLRSLEHEILSAPSHARALDALQVSPYRITQVVDSDGLIHSIREDTRTEFSCPRQGYFVHPRTCARFYRCVKFDQLSPDYTVFEFDCPAGLAFDGRYEVCVWPGSLPHSQACPGSSEIAPVPQTRFVCPGQEGYYADPENCRWFFACLDHGTSPLSAYEFRCPFGLGFDAEKLKCDWPWLVPACGNVGRYEAQAHGFNAAILTGAAGYNGQTADSVNVAGHQSLISGAAFDNHVGIQGGFLSQNDALDGNFIASQELANGQAYQLNQGHDGSGLAYQSQGVGLVQPTKYSSGSLLLDDYRLPNAKPSAAYVQQNGIIGNHYNIANGYTSGQKTLQYQGASYSGDDNSGAYVHDPTGDHAVPYRHDGAPAVPYIHDASVYKDSNDYKDYNLYKDGSQDQYEGKYGGGQYAQDNAGEYHENGGVYAGSNSGAYSGSYNGASGSYNNDNAGKYVAGVYQSGGNVYGSANDGSSIQQYHGAYGNGNSAEYLTDSKAYTGSSHTLAAGAVNVGLVGKTTLLDTGYYDQGNYQNIGAGNGYAATKSYSSGHGVVHQVQNAQLAYVSQPAVAINHLGTDALNHDGYSYVTTPTASVIPTTATPFAVTTAIPAVTYKTTFLPEPPKTSIKQIFGYSQPTVTYVQPTVVPIKQITPKIDVTDYNQAVDYKAYQNRDSAVLNNYNTVKSESSGYDYPKPGVQFEEGVTYTTAAPAIQVSTFKPQGFSHSKNTQSVSFGYSTPAPALAVEEPFKKVVAYTTGPPVTYAEPTLATYTPTSFSQQTIHNVQAEQVDVGYQYAKPVVYEQPQTAVEYASPQPEIVQPVVSYQPQVYTQQTFHKTDANIGYEYKKPVVTYEKPKSFVGVSTAQPAVVDYQPKVYTQQTYHNTDENNRYEYKKPAVTYEQPKAFVQVTTAQPPVVDYQPQVYTQQTYHNTDENVGYEYKKPAVTYEQPKAFVQVTTAQPPVVDYQPQVYTQQTYHNTDENVGYEYKKPAVTYEQPKAFVQVTRTQPPVVDYQPQVYTQQTYHDTDVNVGYEYKKPAVTYEQRKAFVQVTTAQPPVVDYQPQVYTQQTYHNTDDNVGYEYNKPAVKYEQPKAFFQVTTAQSPVVDYQPQVYTQQTYHKVDSNVGYEYTKPVATYEQPKTVGQVTTPQPEVVSYQPQVYTQQTIHTVDVSKVNTYGQKDSGYEYSKPAVQFVEGQKPVEVSTVQPQTYHQQIIHKVETPVEYVSSTPAPQVYHQPAVTQYENPILKHTQKIAPVTYVQPTYQPIVQQHEVKHLVSKPVQYETYNQNVQLNQGYQYSQPEIQRETYNYNTGSAYSLASDVSHQVIHQTNANQYDTSNKKVTFVSTTPAKLAYEDHYVEYEAPKKVIAYKASEYVPPKETYKVSTVAPIVQQQHYSKVQHDYQYENKQDYEQKVETYTAPDYIPPKTDYQPTYTVSTEAPVVQEYSNSQQNEYNYNQEDYNQYDISQKVAPIPQVTFNTVHEQPKRIESYHISSYPGSSVTIKSAVYQDPEIQVGYNAEEYIPPVIPLVSTSKPPVTSTYLPPTYFTTSREYLPPTPKPTYSTTSREYLPPTPTPEYLPPKVKSTYRPSSTTARPVYKSTVPSTTYKFVESTTFQAPEYLPPSDEDEQHAITFESFGLKNEDASSKIRYNPYQESAAKVEIPTVTSTALPTYRKQNIVVQTAKANLLGFGTVGPDAGLVSYSSTPAAVSSTEGYLPPKRVTSTYAPIEQELVEVTPSPLPVRRTKPKVAVVTKINDFNPFLTRKLGAVCSCQSPIVVLRGRRPDVDYDDDDYSDYGYSGRGDIGSDRLKSSGRVSAKTVTVAPVTSTINPIIVPDDSYYQDIQESVSITPKNEKYISSTPLEYYAIEKSQSGRAKALTVAPTYRTVLLDSTPSPIVVKEEDSQAGAIDSQSFNRYGPGGWRGRDETLQGSVDCQRAGLFRHPKQCNKFYACRWDTHKNRFTLHVFNCPVQLSFDPTIGACNWPSQGPACQGDTLLNNNL